MNKTLKKIVLTITLGSLMLTFAGCGKDNSAVNTENKTSTETTETTGFVNEGTLEVDPKTGEPIEKLDKENAIVINLEDAEQFEGILDLFKDNQIKAEEQYLNKTVKITGEVSSIEKFDGRIRVWIDHENLLIHGAELLFNNTPKNREKIADLTAREGDFKTGTPGDTITVYGRVESGKSAGSGSISIGDCEIE